MAIDSQAIDGTLALVLFSRQFSTMIDAGVSLIRTLEILRENAPAPFGEAAGAMIEPLLAGQTLSHEMGEMPDLFSPFYVKMVRVGEVGGILEVTLRCLADLLEEGWRITRRSGLSSKYSWLFHPNCRITAEDWAELNDRQRPFILMLFCRSLGMMLSSGVPARMALETAADVLPAAQREAVRGVAAGDLQQGVSERLAAIGFLPSLVTQMMEVGEKHGAFDQMMDKAADVYAHELQCRMMA